MSQRFIVNVQWMFPIFLVSVWIHLKPDYFWPKKGRLLHEMIPLKCTELCPKRNHVAGGKKSLDSFLRYKE